MRYEDMLQTMMLRNSARTLSRSFGMMLVNLQMVEQAGSDMRYFPGLPWD